VQLEDGSHWNSSGDLDIKSSEECSVQLNSAHFNHHGSLNLNRDSRLNFNGSADLWLHELDCSPGSQLNINGNYSLSIDKVNFNFDNMTRRPVLLNFQLSTGEQPKIGRFFRSNATIPETISEITDNDQIIQLKQAFAAIDLTQAIGTHYYGIAGENPNARNLLISTSSPLLRSQVASQLPRLAATERLAMAG
jgi:hypothetical protein